jgi:hypothetical protein
VERKVLRLSAAVFIAVIAMSIGSRSQSLAAARDVEEERLQLQKTGYQDPIKHSVNSAHLDREIRYVSGPDNRWFTEDDVVCHFYFKNLDANGNIIKRSYLLPGEDGLPFTYDDKLQDYQIFDIGPDGKVKQEVSFDAKDKKIYTAVYEYDAVGRKSRVIRYNPRRKIIREILFRYNDQGQVFQDEEYTGKKLEKYHRFEYDAQGRLWRVVEFLDAKNGSGADGDWFTADDVVSSAKEYFYDERRKEGKDKKYIGAGPDGEWFTADDEMQYYTLSAY